MLKSYRKEQWLILPSRREFVTITSARHEHLYLPDNKFQTTLA